MIVGNGTFSWILLAASGLPFCKKEDKIDGP